MTTRSHHEARSTPISVPSGLTEGGLDLGARACRQGGAGDAADALEAPQLVDHRRVEPGLDEEQQRRGAGIDPGGHVLDPPVLETLVDELAVERAGRGTADRGAEEDRPPD